MQIKSLLPLSMFEAMRESRCASVVDTSSAQPQSHSEVVDAFTQFTDKNCFVNSKSQSHCQKISCVDVVVVLCLREHSQSRLHSDTIVTRLTPALATQVSGLTLTYNSYYTVAHLTMETFSGHKRGWDIVRNHPGPFDGLSKLGCHVTEMMTVIW